MQPASARGARRFARGFRIIGPNATKYKRRGDLPAGPPSSPKARARAGTHDGKGMSAEAPTELSAIYSRELDFVWRSVRRLGVPVRDLPDVTNETSKTIYVPKANVLNCETLRTLMIGISKGAPP